jgi:hypothetical protein
MGPIRRPEPRPFAANARPDPLAIEPDAMELCVKAVRIRMDRASGFGFVTPLAMLSTLGDFGLTPEELAAAQLRARGILRAIASQPDEGGC